MGFLAPALPWIGKGAALIGGLIGGKKGQSSAQKRSPEEAAALAGAQNIGTGLTTSGTDLTNTGLPAAQKSLSYYATLLGGNRAAMAQATAAPRGALTDVYRGATRNLEHSGIQGASRDLATSELNRDRTAKIAGLTTGVQPAAAGALADLGTNLVSQGGQRLGAAGSLYSMLLGQGAQNRQYARGEGEKMGTSIGSLMFDILSLFGKKKKTGEAN